MLTPRDCSDLHAFARDPNLRLLWSHRAVSELGKCQFDGLLSDCFAKFGQFPSPPLTPEPVSHQQEGSLNQRIIMQISARGLIVGDLPLHGINTYPPLVVKIDSTLTALKIRLTNAVTLIRPIARLPPPLVTVSKQTAFSLTDRRTNSFFVQGRHGTARKNHARKGDPTLGFAVHPCKPFSSSDRRGISSLLR